MQLIFFCKIGGKRYAGGIHLHDTHTLTSERQDLLLSHNGKLETRLSFYFQ